MSSRVASVRTKLGPGDNASTGKGAEAKAVSRKVAAPEAVISAHFHGEGTEFERTIKEGDNHVDPISLKRFNSVITS